MFPLALLSIVMYQDTRCDFTVKRFIFISIELLFSFTIEKKTIHVSFHLLGTQLIVYISRDELIFFSKE